MIRETFESNLLASSADGAPCRTNLSHVKDIKKAQCENCYGFSRVLWTPVAVVVQPLEFYCYFVIRNTCAAENPQTFAVSTACCRSPVERAMHTLA